MGVWVVERRLHESMCIHLALRRGRGLSVCGQGTTCACHTTVRIHSHCPLPSRVLQPAFSGGSLVPLEKGGQERGGQPAGADAGRPCRPCPSRASHATLPSGKVRSRGARAVPAHSTALTTSPPPDTFSQLVGCSSDTSSPVCALRSLLPLQTRVSRAQPQGTPFTASTSRCAPPLFFRLRSPTVGGHRPSLYLGEARAAACRTGVHYTPPPPRHARAGGNPAASGGYAAVSPRGCWNPCSAGLLEPPTAPPQGPRGRDLSRSTLG
jgi:hypothetical protein